MSSSLLSKIAHRLFDSGKRIDYWFAAALGILPAVFAWHIGVAEERTIRVNGADTRFQGYWQAFNFMMFIVALPLGLYLTRRAASRVVPVLPEQPGGNLPGVIALFPQEGRASAYQNLRSAILGPRVIGASLLVTAVINIADLAAFVPFYVRAFASRPAEVPKGYEDWSMMLFFTADGNPLFTIPMLLFVYGGQFCLILLPVLFFLAAFRHNLFFLQNIYQRRCEPAQTPSSSIVIDIEDGEKCFGFRTANRAFNAQVAALGFCGVIMLGSRFAVVWKTMGAGGTSAQLSVLFPNAGQIMLAIGWLAALAVVSMPAIVKMLPMIPNLRGPSLERTTAANYLREFLPGLLKPEPSAQELDWAASKFAENAFWPTGNNRAKQLFFLSFLVFLILLVPVLRPALTPQFAGFAVGLPVLAAALTAAGLFALRVPLAGIDDRLVHPPATPLPMPASLKPETAAVLAAADLQMEFSGPGPEYRVTFEWSPPRSNSLRSVSGRAVIKPEVLQAINSSAAYGIELGTALFSDMKLRDAWVSANSVTQAEQVSLRVRLFFAPEAAALHAVRWEALRDPDGLEQFRGENRWLSRYIASSDDKPAPPRSREGLKSLAVISSPKQLKLSRAGLEPIPVAEEEQRARGLLAAASGGEPEILASGDKTTVTLSGIMDRLRAGADIVYLICHGDVREGVPRLLLEKDDQTVDWADANVFVQSLRDLAVPPALIVLASCQSAGSGSTEDATIALGPQLAAAGVPAVVAMQGKVGIDTVAAFMPRLFSELAEHGQIDRAVAVARGHIARRFSDYWMPVLFMRSKDGSVWTAAEAQASAQRAGSA